MMTKLLTVHSRCGAEFEVQLYDDGDVQITLRDSDGAEAIAQLEEDKARELAEAIGGDQ